MSTCTCMYVSTHVLPLIGIIVRLVLASVVPELLLARHPHSPS